MKNFWALLFVVCVAVSSWAGVIAPSTSTLAATSGNPEEVTLTWNSAGDDEGSGDLTGNFRIQYATYVVTWSTSSTPTNATTVTIATATQTPGSAQSRTITSLLSGVTYHFVLWSQDESNNWSGISNTTSAVGGYWFDPNQIDVDGLNGGLATGSRAVWGDYDSDGDVDILVSGWDTTRRLRVYKNNGNGSFDGAQIELGDAGFSGGLAWGDYDNDGDLDIVAAGAPVNMRIFINNGNGTINPTPVSVDNRGKGGGSLAWGDFDLDGDQDLLSIESYELLVYENKGDGSFDSTPSDVDGPGEGLGASSAVWGDFENDGDLDILACGNVLNGTYKLRVYKNNGNGTFDPAQIEVGGANMGVYQGEVAWSDFDSDADLDALVVGYTYNDGGGPRLKVYKNNGNGTFNNTEIHVDGKNGGYNHGSAAWGDYDNDGDHDILVSGTDVGSARQLRVYNNNGNGTIDAAQIEVDGLNGGLSTTANGGVTWGDFDNDSDLDILAGGTDGTNGQLRVYRNQNPTANTTPTAPSGLTTEWSYNASGTSTATFKWSAGSDSGAGASSVDVLTYQVEMSTSNTFTGHTIVAGQWTTPGMGNYLRPPKIFDGNTKHGIMLHSLPTFNTTYYYRVKTIDTGLKESAWSDTMSLYAAVASSAPFAVADLLASGQAGQGQIFLTWTAPMNINAGANAAYDVRYSTTGAITNDTEFDNATSVAGEPSPGLPGVRQSMVLAGLTPMVTYYFGIKSSHDNGTSPLDVGSPRASAVANPFDASQINIDGENGGLIYGGLAWGDFDNDADLDLLVNGEIYGSSRQLRIYKNNGNGTMDASQIEVDGSGNGLLSGSAWGDFDSDGDLDILVSGTDGTNRQLRVYKNNGNGTMNATQIEVGGLNGGLSESRVDWGDFDNDGDLDVLVAGTDGTNRQLRIYKNNGNGTLNASPIEVGGVNGGLSDGGLAWGDYDNDGDLDILASGTANGSNGQLRVYKNNGNGTMDPTQIEVDALNGGLYSGTAIWGDTDADGDLDILVSGYNGNYQLRLYTNNGNGTIDAAQVEVDGLNGGLRYSSVAWGDYDNDGDQDILACGTNGLPQLRVYRSNGNGTFDSSQLDIEGVNSGISSGSLSWGDYDNDGDLDVGMNGSNALGYTFRVYKNYCATANSVPTAPGGHSGSFSFNAGSVSVASFTWAAGTDSGTGATAENGLTYDIQLSTVSNFSSVIFPGQLGASPRLGSYLKPPKTFNSNTYYGVVMKSTDSWNAQTTASYGLRTDTTYYYRVKTVDSALAESSWSSGGSAYTGVSPSTSTLAGASTATEGEVLLTWNSAGDDGMNGNVTGTYRIQYATYTVAWSTSSTPTDATTVTISTTNATPGSAETYTATGLTPGLTYYFVLWSGDEVPNWSEVSNTALVYLPVPAMVILAEAVGQPGWIGQGETQRILGTAQVVSDSAAGVTISSVAVRETGAYTADSNLTNVEVWVSSSGYIDGTAVRLDDASKSFSGDIVAFDQNVTVSTVPLYYIVRADVSGSATEGTVEIALEIYTTANTTNNPIAFTNGTEIVAPPSGNPSGLTATAENNLLRVNLSWSGATGADSYSIYRATHSGVTTTDFLLGISGNTSFTDDSIPPNQTMYYAVTGHNRAGGSNISGAANANSVDLDGLTKNNIYLRAGLPFGTGEGTMAYESPCEANTIHVDSAGNIYIADTTNNRIRFVPKISGTYFGQAMTANYNYTIAGNGVAAYVADNVAATSTPINRPEWVTVDAGGNVYIAEVNNHRIRFVPKSSETYFGQAMTANYIYTIAGNGSGGYLADNVAATSTRIYSPFAVSVDVGGNVYIADTYNYRIRFVPKSSGTYFGQAMTANYIYTIAGNGTGGYLADNVAATSTQINGSFGITVDVGGNVYFSEYWNHRIRFVPKYNGTYFGQAMTANYIYTIVGGLSNPVGVSLDADGNVYIGDRGNQRIRFMPRINGTYFGQAMTANNSYIIAGNGANTYLADNVAATSTSVLVPRGVSVDPRGNVYLTDNNRARIRFIPKFDGTYWGQAMRANYIYSIAGNGTGGVLVNNAAATASGIYNPGAVSVDDNGNIYIADTYNNRLRYVPKSAGTYFGQAMTANSIYTIAGNGTNGYLADNVAASSTRVNFPQGVSVDASGNAYIADTSNNRIRFVPKVGGTYFGQAMTANYIYTIAGNGTAGYLADDMAATSTQINFPSGVTVNASGDIYIADTTNHRIRFVPKTDGTYYGQAMTANFIYTIAGTGTGGYAADDVAATSTNINSPWGVSVDAAGNVSIADTTNHRIRFIPQSSGTYFGQAMTANFIYTIAGNGTGGYLADNVAANATRINAPYGVSVDAGGNLTIADRSNHRIRFVPKRDGTYFGQAMTANYIYTVGGTGTVGFNGENALSTTKSMNYPNGVFVEPNGTLYVADTSNFKIRMITSEDFVAPSTSTLAATAGVGQVSLNWSSAGDDGTYNNLTGNYRIQYATYTASWSTGSTPSNATTVTISTTNATLGSAQSYVATGLTQGNTYYFVLWSGDEVPNWSDVSNTASAWLDGTAPSTSTLTAVPGDVDGEIDLTWASAGDNGESGNLTGTYRIQYATYTVAWSTSSTPTDATTVTISTTNATPGSAETYTATGLTAGLTYYFVLWSGDEVPNWSEVSNTALVYLPVPAMVTLAEAVGQPGWIGQGETQRILGTAQVVSDSAAGVTISSVAVRETGAYTADGNLTNVEVWVSSRGYIDATAVRLDDASKSFSGDIVAFDQDVTVSTVPLYFIVRADVAGGATEGTFDVSLQVYTTANTTNNPLAFTNATDVVAPPSGSPSGLTATAEGNLLRVNLSWSGASGADSYTIYRATHSGVTTTDTILGMTDGTSFVDNYIPPAHQMHYKIAGSNRAGTALGNASSVTSVDIPALLPGYIFQRAGLPSSLGDAFRAVPQFTTDTFIDPDGNVFVVDSGNFKIRFIPKANGTYFGQAMKANYYYTLAGGWTSYGGDGGLAINGLFNSVQDIAVDTIGNVYIADAGNHRIRFIARTTGTYFGQAMTANYIYTIAGTGTGGFNSDNVAATSAHLNGASSVSLDADGNVYIGDSGNHRIRFIPRVTGTYFGQAMTAEYIYTIAGTGTGGYNSDNVAATSAQLNGPQGLCVDVAGNVSVADYSNHRIRFIPKSSGIHFSQFMTANNIYTIAGTGVWGASGDGGIATAAKIYNPTDVDVDETGNLFIADRNNHRIRIIANTSGTYFGQSMTANFIYTIAGTGTSGSVGDGGVGTLAWLYNPKGVSLDLKGNVYIADGWNHRIRLLPKTSGTYFGQSMVANSIYTIAGDGLGEGSGLSSREEVVATTEHTYRPGGISVDPSGNIYIAATGRIRFVPKNNGTYWGQNMLANFIYTIVGDGAGGFAGDGGPATLAKVSVVGVAVDFEGNVYVPGNNRIRFIPKSAGTYFGQLMSAHYIYTIAGNGTAAYGGDGGVATSAQLNGPICLSVDLDGNVSIADTTNHRVRFIPKTSGTYFGQSMTAAYIYTVAGDGTGTYGGDGGVATSAQLKTPNGVSFDVHGNILVADTGNNRIRFIAKTAGTYYGQVMTANYIYTLTGDGTASSSGDGGLASSARVNSPYGVSVDVAGNISIADYASSRIRFIPTSNKTYFGQARTANYIYTIAGNGTIGYSGENTLATGPQLNRPQSLYSGGDHMVYLSDTYSNKVRMIAGEDYISPSTSTLTAVPGSTAGTIDLSWSSAGDDMVTLGNLTGDYRIQYATYTASWSTGSTPSNATTVTISTTNATPGSAQTYTATGLTGGSTYYFVLWTGDEVPNWSDVSNTASVLLTPSVPSTGAITARSQTTLTAGWAFSLGTSSYTFVVSTAPDNPPVAVVGSSVTADLSGTVNALTPNTTYFGFVNACNGAGCSAYRAVGSTVTWANPPVSLSTTAMDTVSATLSWDSNSNPAGTVYVVETATEPGGSYTVSFSTVEVTALLTGLSPGTPACYRVVANSWDNVPTTPSNELCFVPAYTNPGAGSLTTVDASSIRGDWGPADGVTSYTLSLSTMADNPPVAVAASDTTAGLNTTIAGLTANTTYFGFVTGCNDNGCSANTVLGSTVTLANPATSLSTTTLTSLTATLAWTANNNPTGTRYRLERSTSAGGSYSLEMSTAVLTVGVAGLAPGETACFRVIAQSHGGVDAAASNELCLVPAYTDPGAGSLTTVDASSIRGDWGSADGATSYTLRLSTMADNPPVAVAGSDTTAGLNTTIAGLTANTTYYGFVTGCNDNGCSANTVLGSTVTFATVPQGLGYTGLSAAEVTVSFSGNGNPLGTNYEVERAQDGGAFVQVLVTTQTTVPFTGLTPGASYVVRVRAVSHGGVASGYSGSLSFTTIGAGPAAIVNLRGTLGGGGITYAWDPVTRDTNGDVLSATVTYRLLRSNSPSGPFATEWATTTGTLYGLALSPPPQQYLVVQAEHLNLPSSLSAVIDNVGGGRYVYATSVGTLAVAPQGLLTGLTSERHTVAVESHNADGGGTGFDVTVVNPSGGSAGDVTFSPVGELTMGLAGATGGVRAVEKWMGSRWSLVGSARVGPPGVVTVTIPRTGVYRVMGSPAGGPLVREVYNRSFSPNGDGRAESVVFRLENPENLPMEGAIYSSENMHVADMAAGPIPGLTLTWDGRARHGAMCEGGIYTYEITVGGRRMNGIVVLLK